MCNFGSGSSSEYHFVVNAAAMMAFVRRWLFIFVIVVYPSGCISEETFISSNNSLLSQYDQMVCDNEPSCSLINHYSIPDDRRSLDRRNCLCDVECATYRDCCYDSATYKRQEQLKPQIFYCPPTPTMNVYMKTNCPATWPRDGISALCEKSMEELRGDNLLLILPVTNNETSTTYGNMYCAMCHNDANFEPWILEPVCWPSGPPAPTQVPLAMFYNTHPSTLPLAVYVELHPSHRPYVVSDSSGKTILNLYLYREADGTNRAFVHTPYNVATYSPSAPSDTYQPAQSRRRKRSSLHTAAADTIPYDENAPPAYDSEEVWKYARYNPYHEHFVATYNGQNFVCDIGPKLPPKLRVLTRTCVPRLIDTCLPGADPVQIQYCREFTSIVYNKYSRRAYRNKYCAYCNNELPTYLTGCLRRLSEEYQYHKDYRVGTKALSGGINPCSRPGASKELNCAYASS